MRPNKVKTAVECSVCCMWMFAGFSGHGNLINIISIPLSYIYIYIYICVCVCVCEWFLCVCPSVWFWNAHMHICTILMGVSYKSASLCISEDSWLISLFNSIPTFMDNLMPKPKNCKNTIQPIAGKIREFSRILVRKRTVVIIHLLMLPLDVSSVLLPSH